MKNGHMWKSYDDILFERLSDRCNKYAMTLIMVSSDGNIREVKGPQADNHELINLAVKIVLRSNDYNKNHTENEQTYYTLENSAIIDLSWANRKKYACRYLAIAPMKYANQSPENFIDNHEQSGKSRDYCECIWVSVVKLWYTDLDQQITQEYELDNMSQQLSDTYEELNLLYRIGENVTLTRDPYRFIRTVCGDIFEVMTFRWIGVKLFSGKHVCEQISDIFVTEGTIPCPTAKAEDIITDLLGTGNITKPTVIEDTRKYSIPDLFPIGKTVLVHPLIKSGVVYGGIIACDKLGKDDIISTADIKLLEATSSQIQIFLENTTLYDQLNLMFMGTLEALTASIDAKDPYTCGHSQRVAMLSKRLAQLIGLDSKTVERINIAGLVHDVGKIGVPEAVLCKKGKLTDEEYAAIKLHPEIGANIVKDIPHFDDIIPGVLYHHERFDGKGYPSRLKGRDIPLFGRILAVADSFDAMSSTRTYRPAIPRVKVLQEILDCSGTQFDPDFAPVFLTMDFTEYDLMVERHQVAHSRNTERAA